MRSIPLYCRLINITGFWQYMYGVLYILHNLILFSKSLNRTAKHASLLVQHLFWNSFHRNVISVEDLLINPYETIWFAIHVSGFLVYVNKMYLFQLSSKNIQYFDFDSPELQKNKKPFSFKYVNL